MTQITKHRAIKRLAWLLFILFAIMNVIACFHAYNFTHFSSTESAKTQTASKLTFTDKIKILIFGVNNPRPFNSLLPTQKFEVVKIKSNKLIECWSIQTEKSKGTVILFHGYGGQKSSLIDKSNEFIKLGYSTLLVDFMGSGGSEGNQTTIGYRESEEVKSCFDYIKSLNEKNIYLFGTSLGAVAILKSLYESSINPTGIIIECPFGSMYKTVCARFNSMRVPKFPMAGLLVFWGGIQNGFWAFGHNPIEYAKSVKCSTLLLYGEKDEKVSRQEIDQIYYNLKGTKTLRTYPLAGHENYLLKYKNEWISDVAKFLNSSSK